MNEQGEWSKEQVKLYKMEQALLKIQNHFNSNTINKQTNIIKI